MTGDIENAAFLLALGLIVNGVLRAFGGSSYFRATFSHDLPWQINGLAQALKAWLESSAERRL